nr:unnamed protein product [Leishmania braziliensis]
MADTSSSASASPSLPITASAAATMPVVILVVGMAGTGKTTLVHRMQHYAHANSIRSYFINLDPAVTHTPYNVNIDIRDSVQYGEVMKKYRLGPNGAIMTSLNLFATKIHQVVSLLEKKEMLDWVVVDTPGQIEVFTWSASGQLIAESFGAVFPTVLLFVADTVRCVSSPQTFVSTMLYSSGIMLKQQVPLVVVFNKTDVVSADSVVMWMRNNDALDEAVTNPRCNNQSRGSLSGEPGGDEGADWQGEGTRVGEAALCSKDVLLASQGGSYAGALAQSMSLFLHEFYEDLPYAAVSAASGAGMGELAASIERGKQQALEAKAAKAAQ